MESLWIVIDIVGPLLLMVVVIWLVVRNRRARRAEIARAEQGARELRAELDEEEARRGEP
jgi:hypothetical protein